MKPVISHYKPNTEYYLDERCHIIESWNDERDPLVSIARARVEKGVTTRLHKLEAINERYVIVSGSGIVYVGNLEPEQVLPGCIVVIPPGVSQKIMNTGDEDLIFYCICSPRFEQRFYKLLD